MKAALLQLNATDDPVANLAVTVAMVRDAVAQGAQFVLTPEVSNCVSASRQRQQEVLQHEAEDDTLKGVQAEAKAGFSVVQALLDVVREVEREDLRDHGVGRRQRRHGTGALVSRVSPCHQREDTGLRCIGDIALGAIDHEIIAVAPCSSTDTTRIRPVIRFGQRKTDNDFAAGNLG